MSNRLTFSLASLIFLIALGLVFVPTTVLAHDAEQTGDPATVGPHTHPVKVEVTADNSATPPVLAVPIHGAHPTATISLKPNAATVRGMQAVVTSTTTGTTDVVTLVVQFNMPVVDAASSETITATELLDLADFTIAIRDKNNGLVTSTPTLGTVVRTDATTGAKATKFEVPLTMDTAGIPSGTAETSELTLIVKLNQGVVFSLQKDVPADDLLTDIEVPGGASQASSETFTLVKALPEQTPDKPTAPAGLMAEAGNEQVTLKWTAAASGSSITKYQYWISGTPPDWTDIAGSSATTAMHTVENLTNGTEYTFYVRGVAGSVVGESSMVKATPMAPMTMPGPVTGLTATAGDAQVTLRWTKPTTGDVGSYEYTITAGSAWMAIPNSGPTTVMHTVTGLTNGQQYFFQVRATNASNQNGTASNVATATPVAGAGDTTNPTVTITANPAVINCDTGSTLTFGFSETLAANEAVAANEVSASKGWSVVAQGGAIKLVPKRDGSEIGVTTVTVTVAAGAVKDVSNNGNPAKSMTFTVGPVLTIPAGGYIVVIRPEHSGTTHLRDPLYLGSLGVAGTPVNIQHWECMPDLTVFFGRSGTGAGGGALVVKQSAAHTGAAIAKGSVGISEIMWASDEGTIHGLTSNTQQAREQWIEIHNTNNREIKVTLFARPTTQAITTEGDELDRMSNFEIGNTWVVKGQNGDSARGKDFVSMWRHKNGHPYSHGDNNGKNGGKWNASTLIYRTRQSSLATSGQLAAANLTYNFKGTPGRSNTIGQATPPLRTNVPNSPVIFHEVANRRDRTLEWIELKNVSSGTVNLRNYHISYVDGVNSEKPLYTFPNNNNTQIPAGGLLLLVASDPRYNDDHPVAVGRNIHGGNDQALGIGADAPRYMDMSAVSDANRGYEGELSEGLPDDGNFVLMLRRPDGVDKHNTARNKMKTDKNMIDAVGYHSNLAQQSAPLHTNLWPLKVFGAPNKSRNKMEVETVHFRRHKGHDPDQGDNNKPEQIALNNAGYTGVGYKRHARRITANGGTPGHEDTRKSLASEVSGTGMVTISEIMFDQGDANYPQWIELYNSSDQPVNLHGGKTGWKLIIENYDDGEIPINRLSGTLNFRNSDVQTILPKQTVIVASTRARNSGSAYFDTAVVFPPTRVFSVWDDARGALDMKRSTDPILSTEGFYIELIDGGNDARTSGYVSDSVGNLIKSPNRRVAAAIEWPLSDITGEMMADMGRSSILRRYHDGHTKKRDGTIDWSMNKYSASELMDMGIMAEGWVAAYKTDFREVRQTWFGHPTDSGSPGITGGRVLPVELSTFRPQRLDNGSVAIRWITESEKDNAGFNILRSESRTGEFTKLNTQLIAGQGTTSERTAYEFVDKTAKPNVVYYYQIQDVSLDGDVQILKVTHLRGHVSAAGKATTTWGRLKSLQ